jgi:ABC-type glycerol-3-phosphate transport system substrate-binding protein
MRRHAEYEQLVAVYDRLGEAERQAVDRHLAECPACATDLAAYRRMDAEIRSLGRLKAGAGVRVRFSQMIREQAESAAAAAAVGTFPRSVAPREQAIARPKPVRQPWTPARLLLPAGTLLVFLVAVWLSLRFPDRPQLPVAAPPAADAITEIAFQCEIVAPWEGLSEVIAAFEEANPDVKVKHSLGYIFGTDEAAYHAAMEQASQTADVFCAMPTPVELESGVAADLAPYIATDPAFRPDDFYPGMLHTWESSGAILSVPTYFHPALLSYHQAAFDEAGLPYPQPGWTWEEFLQTAIRLTQRQGDEVVRWGLTEVGTGLINRRLMSAWSPDWQTGPDYTTMGSLLEWFEALYVRPGAAPAPVTLGWEPGKTYTGVDLDPYRNGEMSAMWDASWAGTGSIGGLVPYPESVLGEPQLPMITLAGLVMSGQTAHPDASWRWISYLSQHLPDSEHLQARRSLAEMSAFWSKHDEANVAAYRYALDHLTSSPGQLPATYEATLRAVRAVVQGEQTAAEALAALDAEVGLRGSPGAPAPVQTTIVTMATATPQLAAATPPAGAMVLTFACYRERLPMYATAVEDFQASNPGVYVELKALEDLGVTGETAAQPGVIEAAAAQVDTLCSDWLPQMIRTGSASTALRDLAPFVAADASFDAADFYPGVLEMLQGNAQTWGVPRALRLQLIYYNQYLFDQAGIAYPAPGWTWDDFLSTAKILTQAQADGNMRWGFTENGPSQFGLLRALDAQLLAAGVAGLTTPETQAAVQWYVDLVKTHKVMPVPAAYADAVQSSGPGAGSDPWAAAAMFAGVANGVGPDSQGLAARIGVAPFPVGMNARTTPLEQSIDALVMSAATQHPEESWRWLVVASRSAGYAERWVPARRTRFEASASLAGVDSGVHSVYQYALEHLAPLPPLDGTANQALRQAIRAAMIDEVPVGEALRQAAGQ